MSSKAKLEKDYEDYVKAVEQKVQEEKKIIRDLIEKARKQAKETGDNLESTIEKAQPDR